MDAKLLRLLRFQFDEEWPRIRAYIMSDGGVPKGMTRAQLEGAMVAIRETHWRTFQVGSEEMRKIIEKVYRREHGMDDESSAPESTP